MTITTSEAIEARGDMLVGHPHRRFAWGYLVGIAEEQARQGNPTILDAMETAVRRASAEDA